MKRSSGRRQHYHFIGIGGIGMSALAIFCRQKGIDVTGSDIAASDITEQLASMGVKIHIGHSVLQLQSADKVIYSTAIEPKNPEYCHAKAQKIPYIKRGHLLGEAIREYAHSIAITGTHGKTTISALCAHVLTELQGKISYILGGKVHGFTAHAHYDNSQTIVVEADESDGSFLALKPRHMIISNIDEDHMQTYEHSRQKLIKTFATFAEQNDKGSILIGIDCPGGKVLKKQLLRRCITYGFSDDADIQALNYRQRGTVAWFDVWYRHDIFKDFSINLPGQHNVQNALAVISLCLRLGYSPDAIKNAVSGFRGVRRRFDYDEISINHQPITLIDDYGHHPEEIRVTLKTIKACFPKRRIIHVFEPHRYTRTRDLFHDFITSLKGADILFLMDIYPAGEKAINSVNSMALAEKIAVDHPCYYTPDISSVEAKLKRLVKKNDIILVQGAGIIEKLAQRLR